MRGDQHAHRRRILAAGGVEQVTHAHQRVLPGHDLLHAFFRIDQGLAQALLAFHPQILEAADIAHPEVVDLAVIARRHARQARPPRPFGLGLQPRGGAAAFGAQRARGVDRVRVVPRARAESILPGRDRADRAYVHQVAREQGMHALLVEGGDLAAVAAIDGADLRVAVDFGHEPDAPRAQDAAIAIQHQRRAKIDIGFHALAVDRAARKIHAALVVAERVGKILQRALAALVAHRAIERVVDEQELEDALAALHRVGVLRVHNHALGHWGRARRLQLRHLLDLHEADTARRVDAETGVVAVIGDLDTGLDGRPQNASAFGNRQLPAINGQRDEIHIHEFYLTGLAAWGLRLAYRRSKCATEAPSTFASTSRTAPVNGNRASMLASTTGTTNSAVLPST